MASHLLYRPDIDGLRAIAVLAVVLFHADIPGFSGGFVGVDIFFVISGYLITGIIAGHLRRGDFSIIAFYERRARRILPALFVMLACCALVAPFILLAHDYDEFLKSVIAAVTFLSNMLFAKELTYFGETPHYNPLLHTWSLAVEEQFYIVFPLLMFGLWKFARRHITGILVFAALVSFGINLLATARYPEIAFYVAPTRAWQLLLGSILAVSLWPSPHRQWQKDLLAIGGLVLIGGSIVLLAPGPDYPGMNALYPTLGAALVIYAGASDTGWVGGWLRQRGIVFFGLISYSLYLWHWPLIVFTKYVAIRELSPLETAAVLAASFAAAVLSWRFVEQPFRHRQYLPRPAGMFAAAGAATAAFLAVGLVGLPNGVDHAAPGAAVAPAAMQNADRDRCIGGVGNSGARTAADVLARDLCRLGDPVAQPSFVLWGDSHAEALRAGVDAAARARGVAGYFAGNLGCPPAVGTQASFDDRTYGDCRALNDAVLQLSADPGIDTVILHARWAYFYYGTRTKGELGPDVRLAAPGIAGGNKPILSAALRETVAKLADLGKRTFVVAGIPEVGVDVPSFFDRKKHFKRQVDLSLSRAEYMSRNGEFIAMLEQLEKSFPMRVLYPDRILCPGATCKLVVDDVPLYVDDDHLSIAGAKLMMPLFDPVFATTGEAAD